MRLLLEQWKFWRLISNLISTNVYLLASRTFFFKWPNKAWYFSRVVTQCPSAKMTLWVCLLIDVLEDFEQVTLNAVYCDAKNRKLCFVSGYVDTLKISLKGEKILKLQGKIYSNVKKQDTICRSRLRKCFFFF